MAPASNGTTAPKGKRVYINSYQVCNRCGFGWWPRTERHPKQCPKCKSPYWDKQRVR